jgi:hypothetical protein
MIWTKKEITKFLNNNLIDTKGSISIYKTSKIKTIDDGDIYHRVIFPLWTSNDQVIKDVLNTVLKAVNLGNVRINTERSLIKLYFYESWCNPD